jgi:glycerophosphoryl diester phosphodiesterase
MDTIKIAKNNVKMVAHRGLSAIELENTNAAFIAAANRS